MGAEEKKNVDQLSNFFRNLKWLMVAAAIVTAVLVRSLLSYIIFGITCVLFILFLRQLIRHKTWKILSIILLTILTAGWIGLNVRKDIRKAQGILFKPAKSDELLVIVAQFDKRGGFGLDPTVRIIDQLQAELEKADMHLSRIEPVSKISDKEEARKIGETHNAVFVIWGWYDDAGFNPYFTVIKKSKGPLIKTEIKEIPTELMEFNLYIREGLPLSMSYFMISTIGCLYYWNDEYDKALSTITAAIKIFDQIPRIEKIQTPGGLNSLYFIRGYMQQTVKSDAALAIADYSKAIELDLSDSLAYSNRGLAYSKKGELDQAIADYNKAIELDPSFSLAYYNRGIAYLEIGELDLAIADYSKAIELDPSFSLAYYNRGTAYTRKDEHDLAFADYNKAIEFDPSFSLAYNNRGTVYTRKDELDLAFADYNKAIELDPSNSLAYYNRGIAYLEIGEHDLAFADYNKAIELDPSNSEAYNNRGTAYAGKGEYDLAFADYNKAIELDPSNSLAYYNRGTAHAVRYAIYDIIIELDLALADFSKAIELDPSNSLAYYNRGLVYRLIDFKTEAINDFQRYLHLLPNPPNKSKVEQMIYELKK